MLYFGSKLDLFKTFVKTLTNLISYLYTEFKIKGLGVLAFFQKKDFWRKKLGVLGGFSRSSFNTKPSA